MYRVYSHGISTGPTTALINKQHPGSPGFQRAAPWLLLHSTGRVDRFATYAEARQEAMKAWPAVIIMRGTP